MSEPDEYDLDTKMGLIGLLCFHWSYLEFLLSAAIWRILGVDEATGKIITGGLDIKGRASMAVRLAKHRKKDNELINALKRAAKTIEDQEGERNLAVHGIYGMDEEGTTFAEVHRGKHKGMPQDMPNERIADVIRALDQEIDDLEPILKKYGIVSDETPPGHPPSPQKYQPPTG